MPQAVDCDLFLYADDACLLFQHNDPERIKEELLKNFSNICDWFVDNKLSIHFGEDKTKTKQRCRNEKINWLPVYERLNQYLCSNAFTFLKETCPLHFHDTYRQSGQNQSNTRSSVLKLKHSLRDTCSGQKNLSYLTPTVWNSLPTDQKLTNTLNNLKLS